MDNYDTCTSVFVVLFWCYVQILTLQKPHIPASFNMYLVINKWLIAVKDSNFSGQYLHNHWTLDIGVFGYIGTVWPKEHTLPKLGPFLRGHIYIYIYIARKSKDFYAELDHETWREEDRRENYASIS